MKESSKVFTGDDSVTPKNPPSTSDAKANDEKKNEINESLSDDEIVLSQEEKEAKKLRKSISGLKLNETVFTIVSNSVETIQETVLRLDSSSRDFQDQV